MNEAQKKIVFKSRFSDEKIWHLISNGCYKSTYNTELSIDNTLIQYYKR